MDSSNTLHQQRNTIQQGLDMLAELGPLGVLTNHQHATLTNAFRGWTELGEQLAKNVDSLLGNLQHLTAERDALLSERLQDYQADPVPVERMDVPWNSELPQAYENERHLTAMKERVRTYLRYFGAHLSDGIIPGYVTRLGFDLVLDDRGDIGRFSELGRSWMPLEREFIQHLYWYLDKPWRNGQELRPYNNGYQQLPNSLTEYPTDGPAPTSSPTTSVATTIPEQSEPLPWNDALPQPYEKIGPLNLMRERVLEYFFERKMHWGNYTTCIGHKFTIQYGKLKTAMQGTGAKESDWSEPSPTMIQHLYWYINPVWREHQQQRVGNTNPQPRSV